MKKRSILLLLVFLFVFVSNAMAVRGTRKQCVKPRFSKFEPAQYSEVSPGSAFSFIASGNTMPETIKVNVKDIKVDITIEDRDILYKVKGNLPDSLVGTFARIHVSGIGDNGKSRQVCRRAKAGWLVKITEDPGQQEDPEAVEITDTPQPDS